ncbi:MAG TPA: M17 family peptidase N-terminal domain-containing protein, partial [Candidatus Deferrimicrobium sp.]|nr:M17 family peptidase N-terminal domain-containing protein [Candidatus Deferrimicrobium sp.]
MEIRFRDSRADRIKSNLVVIPVREKRLDDPVILALDRRLKGHLRARISKSNFTGAEASSLLHPTADMLPAAYLLLVGIGAGDTSSDTWRKTGARARKEAAAIGASDFAM